MNSPDNTPNTTAQPTPAPGEGAAGSPAAPRAVILPRSTAPVQVDLLVPIRRRTAFVRANPLSKMALAFILMCGVLFSIDIVSASVMLALQVLLLPLTGLRIGAMLKRLWFLPGAALIAAWATTILAEKTGDVLVHIGPLLITTGSLASGTAIGVRVLALALPGIAIASTVDPTDLADTLVQKLRLPERFVMSALAATRLVTLFTAEWQTLSFARRARGVGPDTLLRRLGGVVPVAFALLVQAIRRGTRLAMAMEGRGFGTSRRTQLRQSRFHARDAVIVGVGVLMSAAAIGAAVAAGTWNLILT